MIRDSHIDPAGRLVTFCSIAGCGNQPACYGIGVALIRGRIGQWYCADHVPRTDDPVMGRPVSGGPVMGGQGRLF